MLFLRVLRASLALQPSFWPVQLPLWEVVCTGSSISTERTSSGKWKKNCAKVLPASLIPVSSGHSHPNAISLCSSLTPSLQVKKTSIHFLYWTKDSNVHWLQYSYFSVSLQTYYRGPDQLGWVENGYCLIIWIMKILRLCLQMLSWYVAIKWLGNSGSPWFLT